MLTTEERRLEFVKLVQSMRTAQKEFKKSRSRLALEDARYLERRENAKYYERQVDRALKMLRQREQFDA